jgi:hypothetical protein
LIFSAVIVVAATAVIIGIKGQLGRRARTRSLHEEDETAGEQTLEEMARRVNPRRSDPDG